MITVKVSPGRMIYIRDIDTSAISIKRQVVHLSKGQWLRIFLDKFIENYQGHAYKITVQKVFLVNLSHLLTCT